MPRLLKVKYVGFRSPLSTMLDHVDGDFTIYEEIGTVSIEAYKLIKKTLGQDYITLTDLPRVPFEGMDEEDRTIVMRALKGLKQNEKLKIDLRR